MCLAQSAGKRRLYRGILSTHRRLEKPGDAGGHEKISGACHKAASCQSQGEAVAKERERRVGRGENVM
jgi:hypothetical protein